MWASLPAALLSLQLLLSFARAHLLFPLNEPQLQFQLDDILLSPSVRRYKVAVIGAGAGGSAAAYFLASQAAASNEGFALDVTVYEASAYVGGRSTVVRPWQEDPYGADEDEKEVPVELGASIFVEANKNLVKAARIFNLTTAAPLQWKDAMSIWDGQTFVYSGSGSCGWSCSLRMLWRYGRAPLKVQSLVQASVDAFAQIYSPRFIRQGPHASLATFAGAANLSATSSMTASDYFVQQGVAELYINEVLAAASTVNYGQSPQDMHALGALISLAPTRAQTLAITGGNRKIFESFVAVSHAKLRLGHRVGALIRLDGGKSRRGQWIVKSESARGSQSELYDTVILATPLHGSGIQLLNSAAHVPPQSYVHLYVTFVVTNASSPSPLFFDQSGTVPTSIYSTFSTSSSIKPRFNSLNYLKQLSPTTAERMGHADPLYVVKLFSAAQLGPGLLADLFGAENNVIKVVRKEWDAYPILAPLVNPSGGGHEAGKFRLDKGLYYINALEPLISTMETEVISAFNTVSLFLKDAFAHQINESWAESPDE